MKVVTFPMYFMVCGCQSIVLPRHLESAGEDDIRDYIDSEWDHIKLPDEYEYVGDDGFDYDAPIFIKEC